jgi:predicted GNAT family acetyltransferase
MSPFPVRQNTTQSRFELEQEGATAVAYYRLAGDVMTFTHTEVPRAFRRRGIASRLIRGALETAQAQGLTVVPLCSFVARYIAEHPEFRGLVK